MSNTPTLRRLFFALWADDVVRNKIVSQFHNMPQYQLPGSKMQPANMHITLHFIGNVDESTTACLQQAAQAVRGAAFNLKLDKPGYFPRPQILWLGCSSVPAALHELHQQLGEALLPCGYQPESRPYSPHVTLKRKIRDPGDFSAVEPIAWQVKSFALVESLPSSDGVIYQVMQNYFLE